MAHSDHTQQTLADLPRRQKAEVIGLCQCDAAASMRLREMGFTEGDRVEVLHYGVWGRSPINVRLHDTFIAMRPIEAERVFVKPLAE